jgi:hypothetical protein
MQLYITTILWIMFKRLLLLANVIWIVLHKLLVIWFIITIVFSEWVTFLIFTMFFWLKHTQLLSHFYITTIFIFSSLRYVFKECWCLFFSFSAWYSYDWFLFVRKMFIFELKQYHRWCIKKIIVLWTFIIYNTYYYIIYCLLHIAIWLF